MTQVAKKILVTCALPYANGSIHLGHMLEHIQADVWVRYQRMRGHEVNFICADDAHGTPIMLKAQQLGITPEQMIGEMSQEHQTDFAGFNISYDNYHSTHSEENRQLSELIYSRLKENGFIKNRTISVSKQYIKNPNGELTLSRPKTETSVRKVSIPQMAVDLLIQEHEKHPRNPYMFPSPITGEMYYPDSVVNLHKKILKDAGLEHIRFHDLRHTFATLALQNGVDIKTVSSMLGHYDAGFTLRTYTHATRQKQDEAAETMGNFMEQVM